MANIQSAIFAATASAHLTAANSGMTSYFRSSSLTFSTTSFANISLIVSVSSLDDFVFKV
jgi:hypothetical protein